MLIMSDLDFLIILGLCGLGLTAVTAAVAIAWTKYMEHREIVKHYQRKIEELDLKMRKNLGNLR